MNTLYYYPIYFPASSGSLDSKTVCAILIVVNAIGIITFIIAVLMNLHHNSKSEYYKTSLKSTISDTWLLLPIGFTIFVDIVAIFVGLVFWVADKL